jgi:predicted small secreted protein
MKKFYVILTALIISALIAGCGSSPAGSGKPASSAANSSSTMMPSWVDERSPENAYWGIGFAKLTNSALGM